VRKNRVNCLEVFYRWRLGTFYLSGLWSSMSLFQSNNQSIFFLFHCSLHVLLLRNLCVVTCLQCSVLIVIDDCLTTRTRLKAWMPAGGRLSLVDDACQNKERWSGRNRYTPSS